MKKIIQDFISEDRRIYKVKIGQLIASSLSGFITGAIVASLVWAMVLKFLEII